MRVAVPLALDPAALAGLDPRAAVTTLGGDTMGTTWRVRVAGAADGLGGAIATRLAGLVAEMSHWDAGSLLSRFNRAAADTWHALSPDFAAVIAAGLDVAARSGGAFDPAIGALVDLWGFGPPGPQPTPNEGELAAARARSGWRRLRWDAGGRRLLQPGGCRLDLSGIAKGHAVDAVGDLLAALGHRHHLVEIGGECRGWGLRPDGEPWWVDVETPPGVTVAPLRVAAHELAVATSGDYVRGEHTIDPRTGRPATATVAVTVLAATAMVADAWASALAVLAPDEAMALAMREGLAVRWLHRDGQERLSPALAAMLG